MTQNEYKKIKSELATRCKNLKYFNRVSLTQYLDDIKVFRSISDAYDYTSAYAFWATTATANGDLYNKNGSCYCEMLSVLHSLGL